MDHTRTRNSAVRPRSPCVLVVADWTVDPRAVVVACNRRDDRHRASFVLVVPAWLHGLDWAGEPSASVPCARSQLQILIDLCDAAGLDVGATTVGDPRSDERDRRRGPDPCSERDPAVRAPAQARPVASAGHRASRAADDASARPADLRTLRCGPPPAARQDGVARRRPLPRRCASRGIGRRSSAGLRQLRPWTAHPTAPSRR